MDAAADDQFQFSKTELVGLMRRMSHLRGFRDASVHVLSRALQGGAGSVLPRRGAQMTVRAAAWWRDLGRGGFGEARGERERERERESDQRTKAEGAAEKRIRSEEEGTS
jgi:hypothetical protein